METTEGIESTSAMALINYELPSVEGLSTNRKHETERSLGVGSQILLILDMDTDTEAEGEAEVEVEGSRRK